MENPGEMAQIVAAALLVSLAASAIVAWIWMRSPEHIEETESSETESEWTAWLPESGYADADGCRIAYARAGTGPTLVLLHGIGASMHAWRFVFRPLSQRYAVVALDLPGFGASDPAPDGDYGLDAQARRVRSALLSLRIDRCFLVGSSMGGALALWLSQLDPDVFPKVAALAPAVDPRLVPRGLRSLRAVARAIGPRIPKRAMRLVLRKIVARPELVDEASVERYMRPFHARRETTDAFWSALGLLADNRLTTDLAHPRSHVLILRGQGDAIVKRKSVERYLKLAPNASFVEHPTAGHHVMEDEPDWTARQLAAFFGRP